ncbi:hypothetical protein RHGRI_033115 [Rhododendron griersonianum]|uniref:Uncharacterized protein n=1 Tax=Rhododendron griersonianum TaxID=479676 RepID=A0AAV6HVN7_9ERIC|nr:hypothetical protein RHGRI_033115 [Rhododendron griersonianum]
MSWEFPRDIYWIDGSLDAKVSSSSEGKVIGDEMDPKLVTSERYKHLCPRMVQLATLSLEHDDAYELVDTAITHLFSKVGAIALGRSSGASPGGGPIDMELNLGDPNLGRAKGLKMIRSIRMRRVGGRLKAWLMFYGIWIFKHLIEQYRDYNGIEEKGEDNLIPEGNEVLGLRKLVAEGVALFL